MNHTIGLHTFCAVSGQSNPDGYTRCLLEDNEAESSLESEDGKTVRVIPALSNNGVHAKEDGIELEEFKIGDSEGTKGLIKGHETNTTIKIKILECWTHYKRCWHVYCYFW